MASPGKFRKAYQAISAKVGTDVFQAFGRRSTQQHVAVPAVKYIPIGGPVERARRTAEKTVPGSAGMIEPGPNASLAQPNVTVRVAEAAERQPRLLLICIAGDGADEEADIDAAEALLERVIVAVYDSYPPTDVRIESERWLVQEDERAAFGVAGEAVALTLEFKFPVIRLSKPVIRLAGQQETCKLNNTLTG